MDILAVEHVIIVLSCAALVFASPAPAKTLDVLPGIVSCRASCLDKFCDPSPTEDQCFSAKDCKMCWDACDLLHSSFYAWGSMCAVKAICLPGCQQACESISRKNGETTNHSISVRSLYDPQDDHVVLEWEYPEENSKSQGTMLYAILLKGDNMPNDSDNWEELTQTTASNIRIKRGLLNRDTTIRLVGANASGQNIDVITSYLDSLITEPKYNLAMEIDDEDRNQMQIMSTIQWRPQLLSLSQTPKSTGVHATVTWPLAARPGSAKYQVSWNVIDDAIEITGHLHTASNMAVLTLWPDALYAVQVDVFIDEEIRTTSETLIVDTQIEKDNSGITSGKKVCKGYSKDSELLIGCMAGVLLFLMLNMMYFAFQRFQHIRKVRNEKEIHIDIQPNGRKLSSIIHNMNAKQNPKNGLGEPLETATGKAHRIPCYFFNQPLSAHLDNENHFVVGNRY